MDAVPAAKSTTSSTDKGAGSSVANAASSSSAASKKGKKGSPATSSPAPGTKGGAANGKGKGKGKKAAAAAPEPVSEEDSDSGGEDMDEEWCKAAMRPVKKTLKKLRDQADGLKGPEKLALLKESVMIIGAHIETVLDRECGGKKQSVRVTMDRHLWHFVTFFWPGKDNVVRGKKIRQLYAKMLDQDDGKRGVASAVKQEKRESQTQPPEDETPRPTTIKLKRKAPTSEDAEKAPIPKKSRPSVVGGGSPDGRDTPQSDGQREPSKSQLNGIKSEKRDGASPSHARGTPTFERDEYDDYARQRDRWRERERERRQ